MNKLYGVGGRLNLSNPIFEVLCTKLYHCVFWMVSYAFSSQMTKYAVSKSVGSSPTSNQREMMEGMIICLRMNMRLSNLGGHIASKIIIASR